MQGLQAPNLRLHFHLPPGVVVAVVLLFSRRPWEVQHAEVLRLPWAVVAGERIVCSAHCPVPCSSFLVLQSNHPSG